MTMKTYAIFRVVILLLGLVLISCQPDVPELSREARLEYHEPIDPNISPDLLCRVLSIERGELIEGTLPEGNPQGNSKGIYIIHYQKSAEMSPGTTLYLPVVFSEDVLDQVAGIYLQVDEAEHYWKIPLDFSSISSKDNGQLRTKADLANLVIPIFLPEFILNGRFGLTYALFDQSEEASLPAYTTVDMKGAEEGCGFAATGSSGLFTKRLYLGEEPGTVNISYEMYQIPDRMDIKYNGKWVASTASIPLGEFDYPPPGICYDGTEGYVSGSSMLSFEYDPAVSAIVEIYMYGCLAGSTRWDFNVVCTTEDVTCCQDRPPLPDFSPRKVSFPANNIGQMQTGIYVQQGDFVFMSTKNMAVLTSFADITSAKGVSSLVYQLYKKQDYEDFRFGQVIARQGGEIYGFDNFDLRGEDCFYIDQKFIDYTYFFGEYGVYFRAARSGDIWLDINDSEVANNKGIFDVEIYTLSQEDHFNRNKYNCCPAEEPEGLDECGFAWGQDPLPISSWCYHEGLDMYRSNSGKARGSQCAYQNGQLVNTGNSMGTFDYGEGGSRKHMILDVFSHVALGGVDFSYAPTPQPNIYP